MSRQPELSLLELYTRSPNPHESRIPGFLTHFYITHTHTHTQPSDLEEEASGIIPHFTPLSHTPEDPECSTPQAARRDWFRIPPLPVKSWVPVESPAMVVTANHKRSGLRQHRFISFWFQRSLSPYVEIKGRAGLRSFWRTRFLIFSSFRWCLHPLARGAYFPLHGGWYFVTTPPSLTLTLLALVRTP